MDRNELKAEIAKWGALGRGFRAEIQASKGLVRAQAWLNKRWAGAHARIALVAYAFVRGVPYARLEPRCRPEHALKAHDLVGLTGGPPEAVEAWLAVLPTAAQITVQDAARRAWRARREAGRVRHAAVRRGVA